MFVGCTTANPKRTIVCHQNKDYLAFSEIIHNKPIPIISGNVDKLINDAKSNLGKGCSM
jgi:hypothetical protein